MAEFTYLICFESENGDTFFADSNSTEAVIGAETSAYPSFEDLIQKQNATTVSIAKVRDNLL